MYGPAGRGPAKSGPKAVFTRAKGKGMKHVVLLLKFSKVGPTVVTWGHRISSDVYFPVLLQYIQYNRDQNFTNSIILIQEYFNMRSRKH